MQLEEAETIAAQALAWIAADPELLGIFLSASGIAPGEIRMQATEPEFLAAVLDFLLAAESHVRDFCAAAGLLPQAALAARAALPGGRVPDWT